MPKIRHLDDLLLTPAELSLTDSTLANFTVATGETVSAGDRVELTGSASVQRSRTRSVLPRGSAVVFESGGIAAGGVGQIEVVSHAPTALVVLYRSVDPNYYLTARVITRNGDTLSSGAAYVLDSSSSCNNPGAVKLSDNTVLVYWASVPSGTWVARAAVLTISGTTITRGTIYEVTTAFTAAQSLGLCGVSSTAAVAAWSGDGGVNLKARVLTISGTTITGGSVATVATDPSVYSLWPRMCLVDTNKVVMVFNHGIYVDPNDTYTFKAVVLTVSGTTLSVGAVITLRGPWTTTNYYAAVERLATNKALAAGAGSFGYVLSVSGTTISAGAEYNACRTELALLDEDNAVVLMDLIYGGSPGARSLRTPSTTILSDRKDIWQTAVQTDICDATLVDDSWVLIVYPAYGTPTGTAQLITCNKQVDGIAMSGGAAGQTVSVALLR
jgi:hypothetical protein